MELKKGVRVEVGWDCGCTAPVATGVIEKAGKKSVTVHFDNEPGSGMSRVQRFTLRQSGKYIAAGWHYVYGMPYLRAI